MGSAENKIGPYYFGKAWNDQITVNPTELCYTQSGKKVFPVGRCLFLDLFINMWVFLLSIMPMNFESFVVDENGNVNVF